MNLHIILLSLVAYADTYSPLSYVDRPCGTDLSNLWLDVVLVVDNSQEMGSQRLHDVTSNILSVFGADTRIGSNSVEPRTTRVGLVTYNSAATLNADLNQFQSFSDLRNGVISFLKVAANTKDSYLATGLAMAAQVLNVQGLRDHYQKVIIVYASKYSGYGDLDPQPIADRLKGSGVKIITVAYGDETVLESLSSPRFGFNSASGYPQIQNALLESNCYCPHTWIQYRTDYSDRSSSPYGVCILPVNLAANWFAAKYQCSNSWNNSHLATEFNQAKHDFIFNVAKDYLRQNPYQYHIGLHYANGDWVWDQPAGQPQVNLQRWSNWQAGFPIGSPASQSGVSNIQNGVTTKWNNVPLYTMTADFFCETYSCDTDNYCDAEKY
ncbi:hypothetical protein CRE_04168 [Caenorhabditis remanei]|uniref:VWFA domain-containing protein n=1 Tax=Caenorhabditis remanei TaxID=31234 RepID=E3MYT0_CAERE|nr:hypothetical protein CRE_04168 [Caenorhabditis remanei]